MYKIGYISLPAKTVSALCEKARKGMDSYYGERLEEIIEKKRKRWFFKKLTREQAIANMTLIGDMNYHFTNDYKSNDNYEACLNLEEAAIDIGVFGHIQLSVGFYCELKKWANQNQITK